MNRRSEKLDQYLNKQVEITFIDGDIATGILEFGRPYIGLKFSTNQYSITCKSGGFIQVSSATNILLLVR